MTISVEDLFLYCVFFFDLLILIQVFFSLHFKNVKTQIWLLVIYCVCNSTINLTGLVFESNTLNIYLYSLFTLIEYGIFAYFIFLNLEKAKFKRAVLALSIAFIGYNIYHIINPTFTGIDSIPIAIETILIFLYCFFYFFTQMNVVDEMFIYHKYQFWVIVGFMVYLGGSFFIYILANITANISTDILDEYWFLTYVFYIVKNIFFAIGISYFRKKYRSPNFNKLQPYLG